MEPNRKLDATKWVERYSDALYAYVYIRVNSNSQAEDIVQETFLSAWKARETYNGTASEKNWLYTICKNKIIDYYRKAAINKEVLASNTADEDYFFGDDGHWEKDKSPNNWVTTNASNVEKKEFYAILKKCQTKLKQIQQSVFSMKYLEDISTDEICETLGITVQNYWVLIHRAKLQLRTCLEKNWIK
ncbi:MAG: sigma-70 family RNA polymerase sigma factor [Chitinophagaceae bacterium]